MARLDVAVAYRVYPKVSKPTLAFPEDKLKLAELCLRSFQESTKGLRIKVWALLDGCPPEYEALFRRYFKPDELELVHLEGEGNTATFERQIRLLLEQEESEVVYFAEDDYLYQPGEFGEMVRFLQENTDVDFVSPYDHRDYYTLGIHDHGNRIRVSGHRHWRTAASTCLTFLTTRDTLRRTERVFRAYVTGRCSDAALWFSLTKIRMFRPLYWLPSFVSDRRMFSIFSQGWRRCTRQLLIGRRLQLWVPVPSIGTHMDAAYIAPAVDWSKMIGSHIPTSDLDRSA